MDVARSKGQVAGPLARGPRALACAAVLLAAALSSSSALAQAAAPEAQEARAQARQRAREGQVLYESGQFERALEAFQAAYELAPVPGVLFNLGQCHRQLGNHERAIFFYAGYLREAPNAPNRADVEAMIAESQAALDRAAEAEAAEREAAEAAEAARLQAEAGASQQTATDAGPTAPDAGPDDQPQEHRPVYRRWWFWTVIGVVVAGATASALAVTLQPDEPSVPQGTLGTFDTR